MNPRYFIAKYHIPAFLCALAILVLSIIAASRLPKIEIDTIISVDKLAHAIAYFALFTCIYLGNLWSAKPRNIPLKIMVLNLSFCIFYGIFMEFLQSVAGTGRQPEWLDMLANSIGGILGLIAAVVHQKKISIG